MPANWEDHCSRLSIDGDFFVNYGFTPTATRRLIHPRAARNVQPAARRAQAQAVLDLVRGHGVDGSRRALEDSPTHRRAAGQHPCSA